MTAITDFNAKFIYDGTTFSFPNTCIDMIESTVTQSPEHIPIIGYGPLGGYMFNFEGAAKTIDIRGHLLNQTTSVINTGDIKAIDEQKYWLEGLFVGEDKPIIFESRYEKFSGHSFSTTHNPPYKAIMLSTKGVFGTFQVRQVAGRPNDLAFTIRMVVGTI